MAELFPTAIDVLEPGNQDSYEELLVSIEASVGLFSLLIAVCDDGDLRDQIVARYEAELASELQPYRVELARGEPSLRMAIAETVAAEDHLQDGGSAVLTVTGAEKLHFLRLGAERSEQEIFFGYLQWTREGLGKFPFPVVLWVTHPILIALSQRAPDFWSWRKGVFRFQSKKTVAISSDDAVDLLGVPEKTALFRSAEFNPANEEYFLTLEDLQALIQQAEQQRGKGDASLATLYERVGQIYKRRSERGESQDYKREQELAIEAFQKAIELQQVLNLQVGLDGCFSALASLYESQGEFQRAEPLYQQALALKRQQLDAGDPEVAAGLNQLAGLYHNLGRYAEAAPLYRQALEIQQVALGADHPEVATSLDNLAGLAHAQEDYETAESLYQQALFLRQRVLGDSHSDVATSLNNLALLYYEQGRYSEAEPLFGQAVQLKVQLFGEDYPDVATGLNNLALLYYQQQEHERAESLLTRALAIRRRLFGDDHPDVAGSLNNLAGLYKVLERYAEAEALYRQALPICERQLGAEHPITVRVRQNLAQLAAV